MDRYTLESARAAITLESGLTKGSFVRFEGYCAVGALGKNVLPFMQWMSTLIVNTKTMSLDYIKALCESGGFCSHTLQDLMYINDSYSDSTNCISVAAVHCHRRTHVLKWIDDQLAILNEHEPINEVAAVPSLQEALC